MGYLNDFRSSLDAKLAMVPEAERTAIIDFVSAEVLTSHRNGLRDAKNRPSRKESERSSVFHWRPEAPQLPEKLILSFHAIAYQSAATLPSSPRGG